MSLPDLVQSNLNEESVAARVSLGGEDELFVTPTRTLVYRADGLLSDESVESYAHDAERIVVSDGRRKSKVVLDYGLGGEESFAVPSKRLHEALHPVLAGVLNAAGITDPGETVKQTFQFSELTLVVTSARVVKHIGEAVWDGDYEEFHYDDVTDLTFEEGSVATSVVVTCDGRQERVKAPNEDARAVREGLTNALLAYHDVGSLEEFRVTVAPDDGDEEPTRDPVDFGEGPDPLSANPGELSTPAANATRDSSETSPRRTRPEASTAAPSASVPASPSTPTSPSASTELDSPTAVTDSVDQSAEMGRTTETTTATSESLSSGATTASTGFEGSGFEAAVEDDERVADELAALRAAVERQNEELRKQRETMSQLVDELRQGR